MNIAAYIAAVVLFLLAALGVTFGELSGQDVIALGLAAFALGHLLPR